MHALFTDTEARACILILSPLWQPATADRMRRRRIVIFVFFAHKKYSHSCIKIWLNSWRHINYFPDAIEMFLALGALQLCCSLWRVRELSDCIKHILICVLKMNNMSWEFKTTWRWVINDRIFVFGWIFPLKGLSLFCCSEMSLNRTAHIRSSALVCG